LNILCNKEGDTVNILAVVCKILAPQKLTSKEGKVVVKQLIMLCDQDYPKSVPLTLWGRDIDITMGMIEGQTVLFVMNARVSCYKGSPQLSYAYDSLHMIAPEFLAASALKTWAASGGVRGDLALYPDPSQITCDFADLANYQCIRQIAATKLSANQERVVGFCIAALLNLDALSTACTYQSCMSCHKKVYGVICENPRCERSTAVPRLKVSIDIADHSGMLTNIPVFGDVAEAFLGKTAREFCDLDEFGKEEVRKDMLWRRYKLCFKIQGSRITVVNCEPADMSEATQVMQSK